MILVVYFIVYLHILTHISLQFASIFSNTDGGKEKKICFYYQPFFPN